MWIVCFCSMHCILNILCYVVQSAVINLYPFCRVLKMQVGMHSHSRWRYSSDSQSLIHVWQIPAARSKWLFLHWRMLSFWTSKLDKRVGVATRCWHICLVNDTSDKMSTCINTAITSEWYILCCSGADSRPYRTLEEREAAYAEARLRILGSTAAPDAQQTKSTATRRSTKSVMWHNVNARVVCVICLQYALD